MQHKFLNHVQHTSFRHMQKFFSLIQSNCNVDEKKVKWQLCSSSFPVLTLVLRLAPQDVHNRAVRGGFFDVAAHAERYPLPPPPQKSLGRSCFKQPPRVFFRSQIMISLLLLNFERFFGFSSIFMLRSKSQFALKLSKRKKTF